MAATDKKTLELIAQVRTKKAAIAKAEKPKYKTNCLFSYNEGNKSAAVNIHIESDVKKLICMAAALNERLLSYNIVSKAMGIDNPPEFTWDGYSVDDWIGDLKMRIVKIQIVQEKEKLEALEKRLNDIISPEKRAELELEAIANELGID